MNARTLILATVAATMIVVDIFLIFVSFVVGVSVPIQLMIAIFFLIAVILLALLPIRKNAVRHHEESYPYQPIARHHPPVRSSVSAYTRTDVMPAMPPSMPKRGEK